MPGARSGPAMPRLGSGGRSMGSHPSHSRGVFTRRQAAQRHPHVAPRLLAAALMASVAVLWLASGTHAAQEEGLRGQAGQVTGTGGAAAAEVPRTSSRNTTIATIDTTSISNSSSSRGPGPGSGLWQSLPGSLRNALAALLRGSSGRGPGHGSGQRHQGLKSAVLPGPAAPNASTEPLVKGPDAEQKAQEPGQLVGQGSRGSNSSSGGTGQARPRNRRRSVIEGGQRADPSEFPFAAMIVRPDSGRYLCTGSLIHPRLVLTAAHCVTPVLQGVEAPLVLMGKVAMPGSGLLASMSSSVERIRAQSLVHPLFQPGKFDGDVAILVLEQPTSFTPIKMVGKGEPLGSPPRADAWGPGAPDYHSWVGEPWSPALAPDTVLEVAGWGATEQGGLSDILLEGPVQPVALASCQQQFAPFGSEVTRRMVCVTGRTCAGDSGGPLLVARPGSPQTPPLLAGHVSFGFPRSPGKGCPSPNPVTAFADVSAPRLRAWIDQVIASVESGAVGPAGAGSVTGGLPAALGVAELAQLSSSGALLDYDPGPLDY